MSVKQLFATNQEFFNDAVTKIRRMYARGGSMNRNGSCRYRNNGPKGARACIAGQYLKDEDYKPCLEGASCGSGVVRGLLLKTGLSEKQINLLSCFQSIHDTTLHISRTPWQRAYKAERQLEALAKKNHFELKPYRGKFLKGE